MVSYHIAVAAICVYIFLNSNVFTIRLKIKVSVVTEVASKRLKIEYVAAVGIDRYKVVSCILFVKTTRQ